MNILTTRIATLSQEPELGSDAYKKWLEQDDFVQFLQSVPTLDEVVLYTSTVYTYLYGVLVPTRFVTPPNTDDIGQWNGCDPLSSWSITVTGGTRPTVSLSPPLDRAGSKTLAQGEQIVFVRRFDGRQQQKLYVEISPRLTHAFNLHYVPERTAYCRFDRYGDIEDVVQAIDIPFSSGHGDSLIVTVRREVLDEYMTMTGQSLVLLFDSTRFDSKTFNGWPNQTIEDHEADPEIWYYLGRSESVASYLRGFQIIRSRLTKKDLARRYSGDQDKAKQYTTFITHDWKHKEVRECSCNPMQLGNYFVESDLPLEISPVFFRPEVLAKYKADSDKYQIRERSITCRHAWHLQRYDINDAGQIFTYLKYLGHLPYDEQLYWKSFNEPPKAPISMRAWRTDFEGSWDAPYDPLQSLIQILGQLHETLVPWWKLRNEALLEKVHYPVTESADEWAKEIHALDKLLVEGFETRELRSRAKLLDRAIGDDWKSLKLLQENAPRVGNG